MPNCRFVPFALLFLVVCSRLFSQGSCTLSISSTSFSLCPGYSATLTAFGANSYTWTSGSLTAAVISQSIAVPAGTYMVKGETGNCKDSMLVTIGKSQLNINVVVLSPTTCIESNFPGFSKPVIMNASGAGSYTWYSSAGQLALQGPAVTVRPQSTSCYTVIGFTSICSGSAFACVTVIPQFTLNVAPAQRTICAGDQIPLTVAQIGGFGVGPNSAFTFFWSGPPGTLNSSFNHSVLVFPVSTAIYTVELSDSRGCYSAPFTVSVNVQECTSAEEVEKKELLTIFPNPGSTFINFQMNSGSKMFLFNGAGEKLDVESKTNKDITSIHIADFPPGVYYLYVQSQEGINTVKRIIKE